MALRRDRPLFTKRGALVPESTDNPRAERASLYSSVGRERLCPHERRGRESGRKLKGRQRGNGRRGANFRSWLALHAVEQGQDGGYVKVSEVNANGERESESL